MKAHIIHIAMKKANGLVYATSPDLPGFYVSGDTESAVIAGVPDAIRVMFDARGIEVLVSEVETSDSALPPPWVAVPINDAA